MIKFNAFMPRSNIHPKYHEVTIKFTDGTSIKTQSTYKDETILAEVNIFKHPAWLGNSNINFNNSVNKNIQKFKTRFQASSSVQVNTKNEEE